MKEDLFFIFSLAAPKTYPTMHFVYHYTLNIQCDFSMMEGLCVAELPQTDGGRAADSCMHDCKTQWLHERESSTHTDKQREREKEYQRIRFLCLCLHQWSVIWPTVACYICPTCLPIFLSMFNVSLSLCFISSLFHPVGDFPPSLSSGPRPNHTPLQRMSALVRVCACVCM